MSDHRFLSSLEEVRMSFACPACGSTGWLLVREHTLWESFHVEDVTKDGEYLECGSDFGETVSVTRWLDITCADCDSSAPANHPLWPKKESA